MRMELLARRYGTRLLISACIRPMRQATFSRSLSRQSVVMAACVDLGPFGRQHPSNAAETGAGLHDCGFKSLIVVTSKLPYAAGHRRIGQHAMPDICASPFAVSAKNGATEPWWTMATTVRLLLSEYAEIRAAESSGASGQCPASNDTRGCRAANGFLMSHNRPDGSSQLIGFSMVFDFSCVRWPTMCVFTWCWCFGVIVGIPTYLMPRWPS